MQRPSCAPASRYQDYDPHQVSGRGNGRELILFFCLEVSFGSRLNRRSNERRRNMKYALLIYAAEKDWAEKSEEEQGRIYTEYMNYSVELKNSGKMLSCEPLNPTSTATTIRVRNGKTVPTDGPFADTKEQLGGIYVVDVKDLNEAITWASKIPDARIGSIEIRPLMDVPEM